MDAAGFIHLSGGLSERIMKISLASENTERNIKAMKIAEGTDEVLDGGEVTKSKFVPGPRGNEFAAITPSTEEHGSIGTLTVIETDQGPLGENKKGRNHGAGPRWAGMGGLPDSHRSKGDGATFVRIRESPKKGLSGGGPP
jgi:hypothetical protein